MQALGLREEILMVWAKFIDSLPNTRFDGHLLKAGREVFDEGIESEDVVNYSPAVDKGKSIFALNARHRALAPPNLPSPEVPPVSRSCRLRRLQKDQ